MMRKVKNPLFKEYLIAELKNIYEYIFIKYK
jgi:hypothetical protein